MKKFSRHWVRSKKPGKQRKYRANAPLHIRNKMMAAPLSEDLRKKYHKRNMPVRTGDKVKVLRGQFKETMGEVERKDLKNYKIFVKGAEIKKGEGQQASPVPIHPSNVKIIELKLGDKCREAKLERSKKEVKK